MNESQYQSFTVRRRDGSIVAFERSRIEHALARAFLRDANGRPREACDDELLPAEQEKIARFTEQVIHAVSRRPDAARHPIDIEDIQDQVELALMRSGEHEIARDYVLYRDGRRQRRLGDQGTRVSGPDACEACQ